MGLWRWLTGTFGRNRWSLHLGIDELFDYPGSDRLPLSDVLGDLEDNGYKAVTAHMLEMFSDRPFSAGESRMQDVAREEYSYHDLRNVDRMRDAYWIRRGQVDSPHVVGTFVGIHRRLFGSRCLCQSKHPLVYAGDTVGPFRYDGHFTAAAPVADLSCVLLNYKYVSALVTQAYENLTEGEHWAASQHYAGIHRTLTASKDFALRSPAAGESSGADRLLEEGFLTAADPYLGRVAERSLAAEGGEE